MGKGGSSERSTFEIENAERGYTDAGFGPTADADALLETPPPFARSRAPAERREEVATGTPTPNIRKVARKAEEVERARGFEAPSWLLPALFGLLLIGFLGTGIFMVARTLFREPATPAAEQAPEKVEDLDGIPVRKGLGK